MPSSQELHYTFPMRGGPLAAVPPIDVRYPPIQNTETFDTDATNGFILNIPSGLDFDPLRVGGGGIFPVQAWSSIVAEKHAAIMAQYAGFGNVIFDDMEDGSGFNTASNFQGVILGGRGTMSLGPDGSGAQVRTLTVPLGFPPSEVALWAEAFVYVEVLGAASGSQGYANPVQFYPFKRYYRSLDSGGSQYLRYDLSFNNGATFINDITPGPILNVPLVDQGTNFILRIVRKAGVGAPTGRIFFGGWALVY